MNEFDVGETVAIDRGSSRWIVWAASAVMATVLVAGAVFIVSRAGSRSDGGASPEEVAEKVIESLNGEDFVALAELVAPAERRTLVEPAIDVAAELSRVGVLSEDLDLGALSGLDIEISEVEYEVGLIAGADDLRILSFVGGTIDVTVDGASLPVGDVITGRFGNEIAEESTSESNPIGDAEVVLVEIDGRWYMSLWHTIAEQMAAGLPVPAASVSPPAVGAGSPEGAVEGLITSAVDLDLAALIGHLDPGEAAALYRYSPLFLDDAQSEIDSMLRQVGVGGLTWDVYGIESEAQTDGDDGVVMIRGFTAELTAPEISVRVVYSPESISITFSGGALTLEAQITFDGNTVSVDAEYDDGWDAIEAHVTLTVLENGDLELTGTLNGESVDASLGFDTECMQYTLRMADTEDIGCLEDLLWQMGIPFDFDQLDVSAQVTEQMTDFELPGIPVAVHRTDGVWFVSPTATVTNALLGWLQGLESEDVEGLLGLFDGNLGSSMLDQM
ncbi:MAG: hypothetical protein GY708_06380 [Actinomycetia bacterium]|nr:hypothetical protein [Actinomycetes bacterium]